MQPRMTAPPSGLSSRPPPPTTGNKPQSSTTPHPSSSHASNSNHGNYFSENLLPSCTKSGLTPEEERNYRRRTCRFIEEASRVLRLPRVAISTAMVFFHRFYSVHSFAEHDRFEVAVACLLLAAKTEECPKKLTTVIQESWRLKTLAAQKSGSNGLPSLSPMASVLSPTSNATTPLNGVDGDGDSNNNSSTDKDGYFDVTSEEFLKLKERILLLERVILHTIGFELSIDHPYKFLVEQIRKKLIPSRLVEYNSPPSPLPTAQKMIDDLVENGMKFANDSMHTSLCLQFHPKTIAMTCVYMSCRICDMKPTEGRTWLDILDIDTDSLASIALQIMELIASKRGCNLEIFVTIRSDLEKLRMDKRNPRKPGENEDSSGGRDAKKPRT